MLACWLERGVSRRGFFEGRRVVAEVGIDSGIGSDIMGGSVGGGVSFSGGR